MRLTEWKLPTDHNKPLSKPIVSPDRNGGHILAFDECIYFRDFDWYPHGSVLEILSKPRFNFIKLRYTCIKFEAAI